MLWTSADSGAPYEHLITSINGTSHHATKYAVGSADSSSSANFRRLFGQPYQTRMAVQARGPTGDFCALSMDYHLGVKDQISLSKDIIDPYRGTIVFGDTAEHSVWLMLRDASDATSYYFVEWIKDDNNIALNG